MSDLPKEFLDFIEKYKDTSSTVALDVKFHPNTAKQVYKEIQKVLTRDTFKHIVCLMCMSDLHSFLTDLQPISSLANLGSLYTNKKNTNKIITVLYTNMIDDNEFVDDFYEIVTSAVRDDLCYQGTGFDYIHGLLWYCDVNKAFPLKYSHGAYMYHRKVVYKAFKDNHLESSSIEYKGKICNMPYFEQFVLNRAIVAIADFITAQVSANANKIYLSTAHKREANNLMKLAQQQHDDAQEKLQQAIEFTESMKGTISAARADVDGAIEEAICEYKQKLNNKEVAYSRLESKLRKTEEELEDLKQQIAAMKVDENKIPENFVDEVPEDFYNKKILFVCSWSEKVANVTTPFPNSELTTSMRPNKKHVGQFDMICLLTQLSKHKVSLAYENLGVPLYRVHSVNLKLVANELYKYVRKEVNDVIST